MKNRIRSIFLLMTVCILGINVFQGYWLYTTYQLQLRQFTRTVREVLYQTVQKQQLAEAQTIFGARMPSGKPNRVIVHNFRQEDEYGEDPITPVPDRIFVRRTRDTVMTHMNYRDGKTARYVVSVNVNRTQKRDTLVADTLARKLSKILLVNWADNGKINLSRFDSLYRQELRTRDIQADFVLDTFGVAPRDGRVVVSNINTKPREGFSVQTPPVPVNPVRGQFIQASFETPTSYLLRKMGWLSAGSVLLLLLTTGCFLYMLSTILKQKKLSEIKNDFINNMTHELKTPIATVSAAVEAMQHFGALNDPKRTETYLNISRHELQRLSDLVEKVLNMAVEEQRELRLNREATNPAELVKELVQRHQLKADKPVNFEVEVAHDGVLLDQMHFGNVLNNLIDNAIKYSGEQVTIRIRSNSGPEGWHLSVADNGKGIPKGYQDAIFDRFFRVPTGNLHPVKGFGLGLYYVRQVIEKHGGRINVRSELGRGSEFEILIPE